MSRLRFRADEVVELVMPCSEAMLHAELAGRPMLLKVIEHRYQNPAWNSESVAWVSRTESTSLPSGYTLSECGIRVVDDGYEGQAPGADDPHPEDLQIASRAFTAWLAKVLR